MAIFEIKSKNSQGDVLKSVQIEANNELNARDSFMYVNGKNGISIINVRNLTLEENAYKIAKAMVGFFKNASDPSLKEISKFDRPIADIAVELSSQYKHHIAGDEIDDIQTIAKHLYHRILS
jgi:hypothetical protein